MTAESPKIKLTYFDIEGVAESVRLAFTFAGVDFEDDRIKFPEWGELKPKTPHGTLPIMTIDDGPMLTQSGAMLRYAGSLDKTGALYPTDKMFDVEQAVGIAGDFSGSWSPCMYLGMRPQKYGYAEDFNKTEEGVALIKKMRTEFVAEGGDLTTYLKYLSDLIEKNGGTFLCGGDKPTIADCLAVPMIRNFTRGHVDHVDPGCIKNPIIVAYVERFCALPEIKGRYTTGLGA
ncbi:putative glutathione S-transferase [Fragilariopsis cylindrus CCMP1102]|uniref:Putative glutathione S-transferase n=1 Tax=Fragilariopsis cylindrus CCMP1102 TaxID=635003 RepID=A0A1E7ERR9_9STRA|nr:putative glutathione S-transferase [Fragilariopsis cylindrus CCMP1102]|eukprot:OEU08698.1 putative glutathione S-transferase [Fragilariopsis cylindrus CCMP1102]